MKLFHLKSNQKIRLTINDIARLWYRFRDAEPGRHAGLHVLYCELIQEAIRVEDANEAFRLLAEAINWYNSVKDEE